MHHYKLVILTIFVKSSVVTNSLQESESEERSGREEEKRNRVSLLQDRSNSCRINKSIIHL